MWAVGRDQNGDPDVRWWNGVQWFDIPVGGTNFMQGVWGDGQGEVWVAGQNLYRWNGAAMVQVAIADSNFYDLWGFAADDVWLAAVDKIWHFDGNAWIQVPLSNGPLPSPNSTASRPTTCGPAGTPA